MKHNNNQIPILVIDDEPVNIMLLDETLQVHGFVPLVAYDGSEGRRIAREEQPALILLDIMMPGEDGFMVLEKLKGDSATSNIPVIFLTATSELDNKLKGFDLGAVDYIVKPFHPDEVLARINLHLQLHRATQALVDRQSEKIEKISIAQDELLIKPEELPAANFAVYYKSLHEAGGDYYDVIQLADNIFAYFIADIAGHDIGTSFMTSALKALLKQNVSLIYSPRETLKLLNDVLIEVIPKDKYLTACLAIINRATGQLTYANAGHPPILYIDQTGQGQLLEGNGDSIGIFKNVCFETNTIRVKSGEKLIFYTDGLIERATHQKMWPGELWRLIEAVSPISQSKLGDIPTTLVEKLHGPESKEDDDVVVLAVEV